MVFLSHHPGGVGHFAHGNSILYSRTTFHPVLTEAILLAYLPLLVERLFQRCHLSRIDEVLKVCDSMMNLHMLSPTPSSCLSVQLSVCATARGMLVTFSPSHVKTSFTRISLCPLTCKILYHDILPVIVWNHIPR